MFESGLALRLSNTYILHFEIYLGRTAESMRLRVVVAGESQALGESAFAILEVQMLHIHCARTLVAFSANPNTYPRRLG